MTGASEGAGSGSDFATVAYDASTGKQLWGARYNGPANSDDLASSVAVSPDGATVFVGGASTGAKTNLDAVTVAYNAGSGAQRWVARYNGPAGQNEGIAALAVDPAGASVFVTGTSEGANPAEEKSYLTLAYNAVSGTQRWADRYSGAAKRDSAYSLAVSPSGKTVFVTGWSQLAAGSMAKDYATVAYAAATGSRQWIARYHGSGNDNEGRAVAVSADGARVFVTGSSPGRTPGYATVAYQAATGAQLWVSDYAAAPTNSTYVSSVTVSPDGQRVIAAGVGAIVAYQATTGKQLWASPGGAVSAVVSPDGSMVYASGASKGDYLTSAYRAATGEQAWVASYNGPGKAEDSASTVALSPDGARVFVTGTSQGAGTGTDIATIAYHG